MVTAAQHPGYRGVTTGHYDGVICINNPYPKPWKFRVRRWNKGWDGDVFAPSNVLIELDGGANASTADAQQYPLADTLIKAMNPACIMYECYTNTIWGRGLNRSQLDGDSFLAAALTLSTEGFGLSLKWNRADGIDSFIQSILDTIGAAVNVDRTTGLLTMKLLRADYVFADLPVFDVNSGIVAITAADIIAPSQQYTECVVTYHDPITDTDRKVKVDNTAASQANGGVSNQLQKTYVGIPTPDLALRVAQRDLRAVTRKLRTFNFTMDRRGADIYPGDVIRIRDTARNIPDMAVRVATFDDGVYNDGQIKITVIQDVFSLPATSFTGIVPAKYVPPTQSPCIARRRAVELPYAALVRSMTPADFAAVDQTASYLGTLCEQYQTANLTYSICVREGLPDDSDAPTDQTMFCGYSPLTDTGS